MTTRRMFLAGCATAPLVAQGVAREPRARKRNIVLLSGETEYKSEGTLADLAQELEAKQQFRCNLLVASSPNDLPGLDALEDADLAILYLRFLELPAGQMQQIRTYLNSGKPIVALRTTTHAFNNWKEFGQDVLGAPWRYHYGHDSSTDVAVIPESADNPVLQGVEKQFHCRSWLYHVLPLSGPVKPLLMGTSTGKSDRTERTPNPVAWTTAFKKSRVFYTSLGHPEDFQVKSFRTLLRNGILWSLDAVQR